MTRTLANMFSIAILDTKFGFIKCCNTLSLLDRSLAEAEVRRSPRGEAEAQERAPHAAPQVSQVQTPRRHGPGVSGGLA